MAKAITKTTAKLSITHDRLAIKCMFVNGEILKLASTRGSTRCAIERPTTLGDTNRPTQAQLRILLSAADKCKPTENNGQLFRRLALYLETTNDIVDAATRIAEFEAMPVMPDAN